MKHLFPACFALILVLTACHDSRRDAIGQTEVLIETTEGDIVVRLYDDTPIHRDNFIRNVQAGVYDGILFNRIVPDMVIQTGDTTLRLGNEKGYARSKEGSKEDRKKVGKHTQDAESKDAPGLLPAEIVYPRHFHKQGALAAAREPDSINPGRKSSALQWYIVTGKKYTSGELAELQATLYDAKVAARFELLQRQHAEELALLKATNHDAHQQLLNDLQVQAEEELAATPPPPFNDAQKQAYSRNGGAPHLDNEYTVFGEVVDGLPIALRIGRTPVDARERPRRAVGIKRVVVR
ncbi:MAG: peptidylprolyl isomerase [Bacteroidaceae bacterium]|nr:peptidylprolyl isomerase [Bacteroidaceae bacterium]